MENASRLEVDPRVFSATIAHNHAFTETLTDFTITRAIPAPPESDPAWAAWNTLMGKAHAALVAAIDYYCAKRVLSAVLAVQEVKEEKAD
jgi:hypothetical protein